LISLYHFVGHQFDADLQTRSLMQIVELPRLLPGNMNKIMLLHVVVQSTSSASPTPDHSAANIESLKAALYSKRYSHRLDTAEMSGFPAAFSRCFL
jgi:hypothetical protein